MRRVIRGIIHARQIIRLNLKIELSEFWMDNSIYPSVFPPILTDFDDRLSVSDGYSVSSVKTANLTTETLRANDEDSNENVKKQWVL